MYQDYFKKLKIFLLAGLLIFLASNSNGQGIIINLSPIDGVDITPDNILHFQVQSDRTTAAVIKGSIRYRNSNLLISYSFNYTIRQGINIISGDMIHPQWQFSSSALQELFLNYKKLPEGTYEYCVSIIPTAKPNSEQPAGNTYNECLYHKSQDVFLINLVDPENNAKIREYNPVLSWMVNYPFANELTYRIRVAPILQGQNPQNAISRNNPVYDERNLMGYSIVYPVYAKPLVVNQPYAWTVDAYFKGILLGGAETWKFTIIDDTLFTGTPGNMSYIDIGREKGATELSAVGHLKLKYVLEESRKDTLTLQLLNSSGSEIRLKNNKLAAIFGDNRYELDLKESANLKHLNRYQLIISSQLGGKYILPFKYYNPDFIR